MSISMLAKEIHESPTLRLNEAARLLRERGEPVIHLGAGEPKSKVPLDALLSCSAKLTTGDIRYTPTEGIPALIKAIIRYTEENYNHIVGPEHVVAAAGAKQAFYNLMMTILNPQDEVVILAPYWVSYPEIVKMCYGIPVVVTPEDGRFQPRFEDIVRGVGSYTKAIVVNSPNNPSGAVYSEELIGQLVEFCEKKDIYLIMDDIYHKLIFNKTKWVSAYKYAKLDHESSKIVVINGVSKAYAMTGFRIGWTISNKKVAAAMINVAAQNTSCPSVVLQAAAAGALMGIQSGVENLRVFLENNRNVMLNELSSFTDIKCIPPDGTFYCMPDFRAYSNDSIALSKMLLERALVVTVPGKEFGFEGHLRLSYCGTIKEIREGIARIKWALDPESPNEIYIGDRKLREGLEMTQYILDIKTPAQKEAKSVKSEYSLKNLGLRNLHNVYWNLPTEALYEEIIFRSEGKVTRDGPISVNTGKHTARAANDKAIVKEPSTEDHIWWGEYNRPFSTDKFNSVFQRLQGFLQGRDLFVTDCYAGHDENYRLPVRIITEYAWHSLFARNMFIPARTNDELRTFVPEFTVISIPSFQALPEIDGTLSPTFILLNFEQKLCIVGGSGYGGEIKKSVFTVLNYLLPRDGVLSMHCSANVGKEKDTAIFFGLSGTGKTTLSADPSRQLIGDDEHGWSDEGVFNFEGGCYAKVIALSPTAEPQIYACTRRFGTVLENVVFDPVTRFLDLEDDLLTENTRAAYPLHFIDNALPEGQAGHPKNIIMLTCDASGVMPPIAKLTPEQAMYHFISGYTSKVSGTEIDLGKEPEITFSACFGAPFMVHHPAFYADMLRNKIEKYNVNCWLVNTGWTGGPYGIGKRMSIHHTRTLLNAALDGKLLDVEYRQDPLFGFAVPKSCEGVPEKVLNPLETWEDPEAFQDKYMQLAALFIENFKKFADGCPPEVIQAGPVKKEFLTAK